MITSLFLCSDDTILKSGCKVMHASKAQVMFLPQAAKVMLLHAVAVM
jgi:hypothetical protein